VRLVLDVRVLVHILVSMKRTTTDAWGRTKEQALAECRRIVADAGKPIVLGRLYPDFEARPKRWIWGERFDTVARDLEFGARWEPIEVVSAG
jgi:hypothetical protein